MDELARTLWEVKYRQPHEASIEDSWHRVATALAGVEAHDQDGWAARFLSILTDFQFLPGGRILAGAGTPRRVTLFNCFVMGVIEDSMDGIFQALKEGALTMQQGGGVGYDFSTLRPAGSKTRSAAGIATGPLSFMHVWDSMCATVLSQGARRGAMIATLRCDHPD
ncbi:MAG TPA: ribonucleoside-diphosphate reductase, adenosylcobalamin-dependent, partial [Chromatiales bacterium]|nr:ribonucleoside-diphosphate reductase, adenosylcobalamin-dependent [Chromatiales bacterium]